MYLALIPLGSNTECYFPLSTWRDSPIKMGNAATSPGPDILDLKRGIAMIID